MTATSIYNALDYGATGNGSTDDTTAIQSTIDASVGSPGSPTSGAPPAVGGGVCYVGAGVYPISLPLVIPQGCHLIIDGKLKLVDNATNCPVLLSIVGSSVLIGGSGTLDGNYGGQKLASLAKSQAGIATPNGTGYNSITVTGLTIQNFTANGVNIVGASNVHLDGLTITNCHVANQFASVAGGPTATNCHAQRLTITGTDDYGFAFYNGVVDSSISNSYLSDNNLNIGILSDSNPVPSSGIRIVGNHCFAAKVNPGIAVRANTCPDPSDPSQACTPITHSNIHILNNHVYNNGDGKSRRGGGIQVTTTDTCMIAGNHCSGDLGDEIVIGDDGPAASSYWGCSNITVTGNKCYGAGVGGSGIAIRVPWNAPVALHSNVMVAQNVTNGNAGNGILVSGVSNCTVDGNHCSSDRGAGIAVGALVTQLHKHGNTINGVLHDTADSSASDLWVPRGTGRLADSHNLMWSTTGQMNYGVQGGPNNNVMMHGLWIGGWAIAPTNYDISGLNVQQTDNGVPIVGGPTTIGTAARAPQVGAYAFGTAVTVPAATKVLAPGWVSVQDFGATGDGTTDDSAAFVNAIAYAQTNTLAVYVPPGTYNLAYGWRIDTAGLLIFGDDADLCTLLNNGAATTLFTLTAQGITIRNLGFSSGAVLGPTIAISGTECTVQDCKFQVYTTAIQLLGVPSTAIGYTRITGNRFLGNDALTPGPTAAIQWVGTHDDVLIAGNRFGLGNASGGINCATLGSAHGVSVVNNLFCEDASVACIGDTTTVAEKQYWTIVGNVFESISTALKIGYSTQIPGDAYLTFSGNTIQLWNNSNSGAVAIDDGSGTGGRGTPALVITGNVFDDTGVATETAALADPFLLAGFTLTGNTVTTTADGATLGTQALTLTEDQAVIGNNSGAPVQLTSAQPGGNWAAIACPTLGPGTLPVPPILDYNPTNTGTPVTVLTYTPASSAGSTPPVAGLYTLDLYVRVVGAPTTITLLVTYTDATGSQTITIFNNVTQPVGSYSVPRVVLSAVGGQPITVAVTVSAFNQAYVSATLRAG
ncbi:MAG TPA: glycosyl hydrolase family 28-related protein [Verrucomicrobiae bacterium]|nr:glycosyl hydrolase family 28-related protein [Verrucomicrobiae bacterium]